MDVKELNQKKGQIDEAITALEQEKLEIDIKIEELMNAEDKDGVESIKEVNNNSFISIFMSIISFVGIIAGVIYVIYFKKEGLG